jgi:hypothetical protein
MATCKENCLNYANCPNLYKMVDERAWTPKCCVFFKDRSRFIELPEGTSHGRLIDADALLENITQMRDDCVYDVEVYAFQRVAGVIMRSPTLIKGKNYD